MSGRGVPVRRGHRSVLPGIGALQQSETLPGRVGREELPRLPAWKLPLRDQPVHLRDVAVRRPGGLPGRERRAGLPGLGAQESDHGGPDRQPGVQPPAGHRSRLCPQTALPQEQRVQVENCRLV